MRIQEIYGFMDIFRNMEVKYVNHIQTGIYIYWIIHILYIIILIHGCCVSSNLLLKTPQICLYRGRSGPGLQKHRWIRWSTGSRLRQRADVEWIGEVN